MNKNIFWFKQDLRIYDNKGLYKCINESSDIIPIFIFDEDILNNLSKNDKRINYIINFIQNLIKELKSIGGNLILFYGKPTEIIPKLITQTNANGLYTNRSYGYFGTQKQGELYNQLTNSKKNMQIIDDYLLLSPSKLKPYKVFTPFFNSLIKNIQDTNEVCINKIKINQKEIEKILGINIEENNKKIIELILKKYSYKGNTNLINYLDNDFKAFDYESYEETRNMLDINGTSKLSIKLNNGLISIRQIFNHVKSLPELSSITFIKELAWREFWNHITYHFPNTYLYEFQEKRIGIKWENNEKKYLAWCEGQTGYPIVDAAMQQLKVENWMHGRARMIVASFLTKNLSIDRRWGEKHFAKYLLDYDSNINIGNWQWSAGVGADPKPLRIFNPILQTQKFDPHCIYIKQHIKKLEKFNPKDIIENPWKLGYTKPIVDLKESVKQFKEIYYNY